MRICGRMVCKVTMTLCLISVLLVSCTGNYIMNDQIYIRIRNDSDSNIDNFWLGAGPRGGSTGNTAYGPIASGASTDYAQIEPVLANYRKLNFVADNVRYQDVIDPQQYVGEPELPPGRYTFAYDIVDGKAVLTLIQD